MEFNDAKLFYDWFKKWLQVRISVTLAFRQTVFIESTFVCKEEVLGFNFQIPVQIS